MPIHVPASLVQGELVTVYDKSFLYSSDKTWAEEGTGFMTVKIPQRGSEQMLHCGLGICMDINPYGFQAPFTVRDCGWSK